MRVAIFAESFLPQVNGVTQTLLRLLERLRDHDAEVLVIAPQCGEHRGFDEYAGARVRRLRSVQLPRYPQVRLTLGGTAKIMGILREFRPDIVHLASPFVLGWTAARAAEELGLPTVAVYQTEVPNYAKSYGIRHAEHLLWQRVKSIHRRAQVNLAPSSPACEQLRAHKIHNVHVWPHGVDTKIFHPHGRDEAWRAGLLGAGKDVLCGYIGRLANEKKVHNLAVLQDIERLQLAIIGEGPTAKKLRRTIPKATFIDGFLPPEELAIAFASLDIFVHTGEQETFGLTVQEAMACGVPVVAPRSGGPIDLITPGVNGMLYEPGDTAGLRQAVATIADDAALREKLSRGGQEFCANRDWDGVNDLLIEHWDQAREILGLPPLRV